MIVRYSDIRRTFYLLPREMRFDDIPQVQKAGFNYWEPPGSPKGAGAWFASDEFTVLNLVTNTVTVEEPVNMDAATFNVMCPLFNNIIRSRQIAPAPLSAPVALPVPPGLRYLPFQEVGIDTIALSYLQGRHSMLLADPQGVGKTVQAIGVANAMMFHPFRILVACPASLRINWQRELDKWLVWQTPAAPVLTGKDRHLRTDRSGPIVISYDLTLQEKWLYFLENSSWDMVIFDEAQKLKNEDAKRTKACLSRIAPRAKHVLLLSGTPIPNRPHEFYSYLSALAPEVLRGMNRWDFTNRYTKGYHTPFGWTISGGRNHQELSNKLRGSGWMVRRDKRSVLPQLPPERHVMVVFPQNSRTAKVVKKERVNIPFTAQEILDAGQPLGYGAIPELRHEMGLEKVPDCLEWIMNQLEGGTAKVVVFAYHQDVLEQLHAGLKKYQPQLVYGPTPAGRRQAAVDTFQNDPNCRAIIGGWEPLGTGWTLTASDCVVIVEGSFVPGDNDQMKDRCVRYDDVFMHDMIMVYYLVVEGSVDASVLGKSADKAYDVNQVMN